MGLRAKAEAQVWLLSRRSRSPASRGCEGELPQRYGGHSDPDLGSTLTSFSLSPFPTLLAPPADTLEMVSEAEPPAPHVGAGPTLKQPVAEGLLTALQPFLSEALVSQVGACYQFNVTLPSGTQSTYFLDLTTGAAALPAPPPTQVTWSLLPRGPFEDCPLLLPTVSGGPVAVRGSDTMCRLVVQAMSPCHVLVSRTSQ